MKIAWRSNRSFFAIISVVPEFRFVKLLGPFMPFYRTQWSRRYEETGYSKALYRGLGSPCMRTNHRHLY